MTGEDIIRFAAWRQVYLDLGGKEDAKDDPVHFTGVKRLSALYKLPYWQVNMLLSMFLLSCQCMKRFLPMLCIVPLKDLCFPLNVMSCAVH
jgi:hypothetical protein